MGRRLYFAFSSSKAEGGHCIAVEKLAEQLGVRRFSLGSFSESVRVFDASA